MSITKNVKKWWKFDNMKHNSRINVLEIFAYNSFNSSFQHISSILWNAIIVILANFCYDKKILSNLK